MQAIRLASGMYLSPRRHRVRPLIFYRRIIHIFDDKGNYSGLFRSLKTEWHMLLSQERAAEEAKAASASMRHIPKHSNTDCG